MPSTVRKTVVTIGLFLTLSFFICVTPNVRVEAQPRIFVVPDSYNSIQEAVDRAGYGDTVLVRSGTYINQTVVIDKPLSLVGENKTNTRIVGDWSLNGTVILVRHDSVTVQNLTLSSVGGSGSSGRGVHLLHVQNCSVSNCNSMNNGIGVWLFGSSENTIEDNYMVSEHTIPFSAGIKLQDSHYNVILRNNVTDYENGFGIILDTSTGNNLTGNQISNNYHGIWLQASNNNNLNDNNVSLTRNIFVRSSEQVRLGSFGIRLFSSAKNTIASNNVLSVPKGIQIVASSYFNLVENNTMTNSTYGLELANNSSHNLILGNKISNNVYGLEIKYASNNAISANNITDNLVGATFEDSSNNLVYHNNFVGNAKHVEVTETDDNSASDLVNCFDDGFPSGGNYWDDYTGADANQNGIGDTPYFIAENNQDNHPIMNPVDIATIPEFTFWLVLPLFLGVTLLVAVCRKKLLKLHSY